MSDITFHFIRHGYSCSNLNKKSNQKVLGKTGDSHLTNWGIISSIFAGMYLNDTFFNNIHFDYTFCSPLIRTWETAACMFSSKKCSTFEVGPYLNEIRKINVITPYTYLENKKRYDTFLDYISGKNNKSINYIINDLNQNHSIKQQIKKIEKFNIKYDKKEYTSNYKYEGDLNKFIKWFIKNNKNDKNNKKINVVVICHNILMINFLDEYYDYNCYKNIVLNTNNFSFKVDVKNNIIQHPVLFFLGIKNPVRFEEKIRKECSLCDLNSNKCKKNKKNVYTNMYMDLIRNKEKYLL
jgi:broad specificity phosphatase PhoE